MRHIGHIVFTCPMTVRPSQDSPIAVSDEQFVTTSDGVDLCFQTFGDPGDEAVLLVMGLAGPMTWWDPNFCELLASKGFLVIRYDNRDTGRSSKVRHRIRRPDVVKAFLGRPIDAPYTLSTMADDGLAILDALGIAKAHVCGVSMGGMIAQTMAIEHPERVSSLVSIMSTTGQRTVGYQDAKLFPALLARRVDGREGYISNSEAFWKKIGSPAYPGDSESALARAAETYDRGFSAGGVLRQMVAVLAAPNRTPKLRELTIPTAVVHGLNDRMVHVSGGRATARAVPGSELVLVPGMGHDLPPALFDQFARVIQRTAARARTS
jgi:pimeloyl-ACP methyl ester carboxylesterase